MTHTSHNKQDRKAKAEPTFNLNAGAGDMRCPEHEKPLVWQDSEMWWRCPTPHCRHKITLAEVQATVQGVLEAMGQDPTSYEEFTDASS